MNVTSFLNIRTLGGLSISREDQPIQGLVSRKVEALLVYVAYVGREVPRESLATLFWDELSSERAMGNLRTALSNLQMQIPDCLVLSRQTAMFNPDMPLWFDALEMTHVLDILTSPSMAVEQLEKALSLYQGDFLSGFRVRDCQNFERWMVQEAEHIRTRVLKAFARLTKDSLTKGHFTTAIDYGRHMVSLDPLSEEGQRGLMLALAYSGQRTMALRQYDSYARLLRKEVDAAPEAETTQLYREIQNQQLTAPSSALQKSVFPLVHIKTSPNRLLVAATPFIERSTELQQVTERLINPDCRLLTITGAGGSGKTRLALQTGAVCTEQFPDGIFFVSLASTQFEASIPLHIAKALQLSFQSTDEGAKVLLDYLTNRHLLLILDNFEHLINAAGLMADILHAAPQVKVLVTSRERLNLQGEWVVSIDGMQVPTPHAPDAAHYSAIQLFAACAARVQPRFSLEDELGAVINVCQSVEGMPLSIELAATWLRVMTTAEIAQQISVQFLSSGQRDAPERHRSIQATFDYSWRLLSSAEAQYMMRLSVFRAPFSRAAAEHVAGMGVWILGSLLEKSLIRRFGINDYDIHELLRQYAFSHLCDTNEMINARDSHLAFYVTFTADPDNRVHGQHQTEWLDELEQEHDNLRAALIWALERATEKSLQDGLNLGASLWEFWLMRGHISEGRQWLDRLLAATPGMITEARGNVTQGAGYLTWIQGDSDQAEAIHNEGLAIRRALNDKAGIGGSLSNLGVIAWGRGDFTAARAFYEDALVARREVNYQIGIASVLSNLALLLKDQGAFKEAITYAGEALVLFTKLDDLQGKAFILFNIGSMTYSCGDWARALILQEEALTFTRALGDQRMTGALLQEIGQTLLSLGNSVLARQYLDESLTLITKSGDKTQLGLIKRNQAKLAVIEGEFVQARSLIQASLDLFTEVKANDYRGQALITLGDVFRAENALPQAERAYRDAFALLSATKNQQAIAETVFRLAANAQAQQNPSRAVILFTIADQLIKHLDIVTPDRLNYVDVDILRQTLLPETFTEILAIATDMDSATLAEYITNGAS